MLLDRFNRKITYLRVSITDRCNFRCVYCMPAEGVAWRPHTDILTFDEIVKVVKTSVQLGIRKVRLTGGEPLVRKNVLNLVEQIASIDGIEDLSLTTNAYLLEEMALPLKQAGLKRINISLDTLKPETFVKITRGGSFEKAWQGILTAEAAGLTPIKLNAVVIRGINDGELVDIAKLSLEKPWQIRFIELMPVGNEQDWGEGLPPFDKRYVSVSEIGKILEPLGLHPVMEGQNDGPARIYQIPGAAGTIGIISPVGQHFCGSCNRLRLTADGTLRPCLLNNHEISLREILRRGEDITPYIIQAIQEKPAGHTLSQNHLDSSRKMAQVGG